MRAIRAYFLNTPTGSFPHLYSTCPFPFKALNLLHTILAFPLNAIILTQNTLSSPTQTTPLSPLKYLSYHFNPFRHAPSYPKVLKTHAKLQRLPQPPPYPNSVKTLQASPNYTAIPFITSTFSFYSLHLPR